MYGVVWVWATLIPNQVNLLRYVRPQLASKSTGKPKRGSFCLSGPQEGMVLREAGCGWVGPVRSFRLRNRSTYCLAPVVCVRAERWRCGRPTLPSSAYSRLHKTYSVQRTPLKYELIILDYSISFIFGSIQVYSSVSSTIVCLWVILTRWHRQNVVAGLLRWSTTTSLRWWISQPASSSVRPFSPKTSKEMKKMEE